MEFREYLRILHAQWLLILLITLLGAAGGLAVTLLTTPKYEAQAKLYISVRTESQATRDLIYGSDFALQNMATFERLVTTESVLDPVIEQLDLNVARSQLTNQIEVTAPGDSTLLHVSVTDENPERAAEIANEVSMQTRQLVEGELEAPQNSDAPSPVQVNIVESAMAPTDPVTPRPVLNIGLGTLLGLIIGIGVAILRTLLDTRLRSSEDIERLTEVPILGRIASDPKSDRKPLIVHVDPMSPRAESFRSLRTNIRFLTVGEGSKTFVISSPGPGEGKTTIAANLSVALAETGLKVALVDCDLRRPRVAELMGIEGGVGLTDVLISRATTSEVLQQWGSSELYVLPAGQIPPNPSELLGTTMMDQVLAELEYTMDVVILDAPPVRMATDAVVVGAKTQGVIFVAAAGVTKRQALEEAIDSLKTAHVPLRGIVANMLPTRGPDAYYSYSYRQEPAGLGRNK